MNQLTTSSKVGSDPSSFRDTVQLAPMPDSFDLDRGLLLTVQAIQTLKNSEYSVDPEDDDDNDSAYES
ncbi:hypothetical protein Tco_1171200, partial [Tanacetum coccineum]